MMFKDLKSGYPIYLFDRASIQYEQAKVMSVQQNFAPSNFGKMEVNITVQTKDGKQNTYSVVDTEQSAYANTLLLTTSKDYVINEVNALKTNSEDALNKIDDHKRIVDECDKLLSEIDTSFRDKQDTNHRLTTLEDLMREVLKKINQKD